jgi:transposase-like protein
MSKVDTLSTIEFFKKFPTEEAARLYFEKRRWNDEPVCGHCGSFSVTECKDHKPMAYRCKDCRKHFSVRTGTVLAESRLPLQKWLLAIFMLTSARKGIPSTQMARELGITQKSAWFLAQRIRETWLKDQGAGPKGRNSQADETYVGGKRGNMHEHKKPEVKGGRTGKIPVIGVLNEKKKVRAQVILKTTGPAMRGFVMQNTQECSKIVTDGHPAYVGLARRGMTHVRVDHSMGEYVKDGDHTNGIESFWSLLKRGYIGVYHYMSPKHLHRYVNEYAFRHNTSQVGTLQFINMTIDRMNSKRLTYKELINA